MFRLNQRQAVHSGRWHRSRRRERILAVETLESRQVLSVIGPQPELLTTPAILGLQGDALETTAEISGVTALGESPSAVPALSSNSAGVHTGIRFLVFTPRPPLVPAFGWLDGRSTSRGG